MAARWPVATKVGRGPFRQLNAPFAVTRYGGGGMHWPRRFVRPGTPPMLAMAPGARRLMPDLRSLEILYWTAQLQSFRKAAEKLHTTQPAVSQRIAALEAELGIRLFERGPRAVSITPKGRVLVEYAERFLRLRAEMMQAVAAPAALSGLLRLGVSETIVHTWLARFIERAHAVYPNVVIDITV